jgi:hypothetical protein
LHINGKNVKEAWMGGNKVWTATVELPYTRLEYIETTQKTGGYTLDYTPPYNAHMEFTMAQMITGNTTLNASTNDYYILDCGYGCRLYYEYSKGSSYKSWLTYSLGESSTNNIYTTGYDAISYNVVTDFIIKDQTLTAGTRTGTKQTGTRVPSNPLKICGTYNTSSAAVSAPMKIYEFKIFDPDTEELICHLIPVLKKEDNKPYLYDLINDVYYRHESTSYAPSYGRLA